MSANVIDGKLLARSLRDQVKKQVDLRLSQHLRPPGLAVIQVGHHPASEVYVRNKRKACKEVGIQSHAYDLSTDTSQAELLSLISELNENITIDGILVQLPLPEQISAETIIDKILPNKDVDGFHPYNIGRLVLRHPLFRPCTSWGVMKILQSIEQKFKGIHSVVVGASNLVGRPMIMELLLAGCTVTTCHRFTKNLAAHVSTAEILISAVGQPGIIKGAWIKPQATVIDVGICRDNNGKLVGDIEFEAAKERAAWITPVPGGVGPMTVAVLLLNTLTSANNSHS